ncbi:MAG: PEPxxWA-CTERM sorting domain-containing protein [Janthinobacterium lividum]
MRRTRTNRETAVIARLHYVAETWHEPCIGFNQEYVWGREMKIKFLAAAVATAAAAAMLAAAPAVAGVNLVANGGFELNGGLGDTAFTGWTLIDDGYFIDGASWDYAAFEGNYFAATGCQVQSCQISQDIATVAGQHYRLSFAFNPGEEVSQTDPAQGETIVTFGTTAVADFVNGEFGWATHSYDVLATGSTTTLTFQGHQDPAFSGIDAVSLVVAAAVPEPAAWGLMVTGFGLVGAAARRRRVALAA